MKKDPMTAVEHEWFGDALRVIEETLTARLDSTVERYAVSPTTASEASKVVRRLKNAVEEIRKVRYAGENLMIDDGLDLTRPDGRSSALHAYRAPGRD